MPAQFAMPLQPWSSPDHRIRLSHPVAAPPNQTGASPFGSLMVDGWRPIWDGKPAGNGRMVVRFVLNVVPPLPRKTAIEALQIGASDDPAAVATCSSYGLSGGNGTSEPDRIINGVRFAVWRNGDAGMSQQIVGIDLRAVVGKTCYAITRISYAESASDGNPAVQLSQANGSAEMDAALGSVELEK